MERQEIARLADERQVTALLSPEAVVKRAEMGKLLKADLLVCLSAGAQGTVECSISESEQGVRLAREALSPPLTDAAADRVADLATAAARRADDLHGNRLALVAVPPFVSDDLLYEHDYLRTAYARLAESAVSQRGGLCVELAEARALSAEVAIAGKVIVRPLPVYVMGEFKSVDSGGKPGVALTIRCVRGGDTLSIDRQQSTLTETPAIIERAAGAAFAGSGLLAVPPEIQSTTQTGMPPTTRPEAQQLAARAAVSQKLGEWDEAAALLEAAMLLTPDDPELHRQAVIAYGKSAQQAFNRGGETTLDRVQIGSAAHFRGLDHLESYLALAPGDKKTPGWAQHRYAFVSEILHSASWGASGHPSKETLDALAAGLAKDRQRLLAIAEWRGRTGYSDDEMFFSASLHRAPPAEAFDLAFQMIEKLQDMPGVAVRIRDYGSHGYGFSILATPEGRRYLDRVEALPNPDAQKAARNMRLALPTMVADDQRAIDQINAATQPVRPPTGEVTTYERLTFTGDGGEPVKRIKSVVPLTGGMDAVLADRYIFLIRGKTQVDKVWHAQEWNIWANSLSFDGTYVWASFNRHLKPPLLLRIDPKTQKVDPVTEANGLPQPAADSLDDPLRAQTLAIGPAGPGRTLLVGNFGRTYLAMLTVDDHGRPKVEVFHEAREQPAVNDALQWQHAEVAFQPEYIFPLTYSDAGRMVMRVMVGREYSAREAESHPLMIDPGTLGIQVLQQKFLVSQPAACAVRDGAIYYGTMVYNWQTEPPLGTCAIGVIRPPNFEKTVWVNKAVYPPEGRVNSFGLRFIGDKLIVSGIHLYAAAKPEGPYQIFGSTLPYPANMPSGNVRFFDSNVYGTLLHFYDDSVYTVPPLP